MRLLNIAMRPSYVYICGNGSVMYRTPALYASLLNCMRSYEFMKSYISYVGRSRTETFVL